MRYLLLAAALGSAAPAIAQFQAPGFSTPVREVLQLPAIHGQYRAALLRLREEALRLRDLDGGTLSPAHSEQIQGRLDDLNRSYERSLRRANIWSVDGMGHHID